MSIRVLGRTIVSAIILKKSEETWFDLPQTLCSSMGISIGSRSRNGASGRNKKRRLESRSEPVGGDESEASQHPKKKRRKTMVLEIREDTDADGKTSWWKDLFEEEEEDEEGGENRSREEVTVRKNQQTRQLCSREETVPRTSTTPSPCYNNLNRHFAATQQTQGFSGNSNQHGQQQQQQPSPDRRTQHFRTTPSVEKAPSSPPLLPPKAALPAQQGATETIATATTSLKTRARFLSTRSRSGLTAKHLKKSPFETEPVSIDSDSSDGDGTGDTEGRPAQLSRGFDRIQGRVNGAVRPFRSRRARQSVSTLLSSSQQQQQHSKLLNSVDHPKHGRTSLDAVARLSAHNEVKNTVNLLSTDEEEESLGLRSDDGEQESIQQTARVTPHTSRRDDAVEGRSSRSVARCLPNSALVDMYASDEHVEISPKPAKTNSVGALQRKEPAREPAEGAMEEVLDSGDGGTNQIDLTTTEEIAVDDFSDDEIEHRIMERVLAMKPSTQSKLCLGGDDLTPKNANLVSKTSNARMAEDLKGEEITGNVGEIMPSDCAGKGQPKGHELTLRELSLVGNETGVRVNSKERAGEAGSKNSAIVRRAKDYCDDQVQSPNADSTAVGDKFVFDKGEEQSTRSATKGGAGSSSRGNRGKRRDGATGSAAISNGQSPIFEPYSEGIESGNGHHKQDSNDRYSSSENTDDERGFYSSEEKSMGSDGEQKRRRLKRWRRDLDWHCDGVDHKIGTVLVVPRADNSTQLSEEEGERLANDLLHELKIKYCNEQFKNEIYDVSPPDDFNPVRLKNPERVHCSYFKSHMQMDYVKTLSKYIPVGLQLKTMVTSPAICFFTMKKATLSGTHYDRDTSVLLVLRGKKEVFHAPKNTLNREYNPNNDRNGLHFVTEPFHDVCKFLQEPKWQLTAVEAGDCMIIPKGWIHSVLSAPGTIAVSFQVRSCGDVEITSPLQRPRNWSEATPSIDVSRLQQIQAWASEAAVLHVVNGKKVESNKPEDVKISVDATNAPTPLVGYNPIVDSGSETAKTSVSKEQTPSGEIMTNIKNNEVASPTLPDSIIIEIYDSDGGGTNRTGETAASKPVNSIVDPEPPKDLVDATETSNVTVAQSPNPQGLWPIIAPIERVPPILQFRGPPSKSYGRSNHSSKSFARPRRGGKLLCGVLDCDNEPARDNEMWLLLQNDWVNPIPGLPKVPSTHPKHVVCRKCGPRGTLAVDPIELLNEDDAKDLPHWREYTYQIATPSLYRKHMGMNV